MRLKIRLLLLAMVVVAFIPTASQSVFCPQIGNQAPQLAGLDLTGKLQRLEDYRGQWVLVDFWATWCGPCMRTLPSIVELHDELSQQGGFTVLGVSLDQPDSIDAVRSTSQEYGVPYPVVYEGAGWHSANASAWCVDAIPATFLINPSGVVVQQNIQTDLVRELVLQETTEENAASGTAPTNPANNRESLPDILTDPAPTIKLCHRAELKTESTTTGLATLRDLCIEADLYADAPIVNRYVLSLEITQPDVSGQLRELHRRFNIDIALDRLISGATPVVEIRETSSQNPEQNGKGYEVVQLNPDRSKFTFIIPVSDRAAKIRYQLGIYDDTGQFFQGKFREIPAPTN